MWLSYETDISCSALAGAFLKSRKLLFFCQQLRDYPVTCDRAVQFPGKHPCDWSHETRRGHTAARGVWHCVNNNYWLEKSIQHCSLAHQIKIVSYNPRSMEPLDFIFLTMYLWYLCFHIHFDELLTWIIYLWGSALRNISQVSLITDTPLFITYEWAQAPIAFHNEQSTLQSKLVTQKNAHADASIHTPISAVILWLVLYCVTCRDDLKNMKEYQIWPDKS